VEKRFLEDCLAKEMSLEAIGELAGKHPSTVGYWLKKHGLHAGGNQKHGAKGQIEKALLLALIQEDLPLREIAEQLDRSVTTVRYWIGRHGIERDRCRHRVVHGGLKRRAMSCRRHGLTDFVLEGRGSYRCTRCRAEAVGRRRRWWPRRADAARSAATRAASVPSSFTT
jgi:IS30 family transposase